MQSSQQILLQYFITSNSDAKDGASSSVVGSVLVLVLLELRRKCFRRKW
jgi:hypothetical protein